MATAISTDNKGFQLLARMGLPSSDIKLDRRPWGALDGHASNSSSSPPPAATTTAAAASAFKDSTTESKRQMRALPHHIPLVVKLDRRGIGSAPAASAPRKRPCLGTEGAEGDHDTMLEASPQEQEQRKAQFRQQMTLRHAQRQLDSWIRRARATLHTLDLQHAHEPRGMWPLTAVPTVKDTADLDAEGSEPGFADLAPVEQWHRVNTTLRTTYHYCLFCGLAYAEAADLAASCPGPEATDHNDS
jgi:hypothetical protein